MTRPLRVLCTSTGGAGHVNVVAPVARMLRGRGHDVRWALAADGGEAVGAMGFEWSAAGLTTSQRRAVVAASLDEAMELPVTERRGHLFAALFARAAAPAMRRDLTPLIDEVRPDVVVRDMAELAAVPMAIRRGIPLVTVAFSGVLPERARQVVVGDLRPLWEAEGLGVPSWSDVYGQLYLHPFPPSFGQRPESPVVRPLRPDRGAPSARPAEWLAPLGADRPLVYATSGTEPPSRGFPWRQLLAALAGMDVDAVATIGPHVDEAQLGVVPANVRVERFVPQADLLGRAAAVVSHGGAGTVLGAAAHGRAQVVAPLFADQWENGAAVAGAGCGIVVGATSRDVDDLGRSVRMALTGTSHHDAAARVADEIAAMPTAADLADEIEALPADH